jgi:hypothetical protein
MSTGPAWECQRSVDVDVPVSFAWQYSDIRSGFEPNLEPGLRRIAQMMMRAAPDNSGEGKGAALPNR